MQAARMAAQLCLPDYQAGFEQRWPDMLGSIPCFNHMPGIDFKNGRTCPMIMMSAEATFQWDNAADLVCLSLQ